MSENNEEAIVRSLKHRLGLKPSDPLDSFLQSCLHPFSESSLLNLVSSDEWSIRAAGLQLACLYFPLLINDNILVSAIVKNLDHENVRTRLETVPLIALLSQRNPSFAFAQLYSVLYQLVRSNLALDCDVRGLEAEKQGLKETKQPSGDWNPLSALYQNLAWEIDLLPTKRYSVLAQTLPVQPQGSPSVGGGNEYGRSSRASSSGWSARRRLDSGQVALIVHETVGWKSLETALKGINALLTHASKEDQLVFSRNGLWNPVLKHENRFVRQVGYELVETTLSMVYDNDPQVSLRIQKGMCDPINQVRLQACMACRSLLKLEAKINDSDKILLGPVLCMNRHYPATGIRTVCREAWELGHYNKQFVQDHFLTFVSFFIRECSSRDEGAREASVVSLGEMQARINSTACESEISACLLKRLSDSSWSVQAAACQSLSNCTGTEQNFSSLVECVSDMIWSVREEAAHALVTMFPMERLIPVCFTLLAYSKQKEPHDDHHHEQHENQMMFSCCSSEINDKHTLRKHAFQYVDGGLRLFRELVLASPAPPDDLVNDFSTRWLSRETYFHEQVEETLWSMIPDLAKKLGKRPFKRLLLDVLIPLLVHCLTRTDRFSASYQASLCSQFLQTFLGENIFRARVETLSPSYWDIFVQHPPSVFDAPVVSFRV